MVSYWDKLECSVTFFNFELLDSADVSFILCSASKYIKRTRSYQCPTHLSAIMKVWKSSDFIIAGIQHLTWRQTTTITIHSSHNICHFPLFIILNRMPISSIWHSCNFFEFIIINIINPYFVTYHNFSRSYSTANYYKPFCLEVKLLSC